jgi:hypothetical protein
MPIIAPMMSLRHELRYRLRHKNRFWSGLFPGPECLVSEIVVVFETICPGAKLLLILPPPIAR